jgi:hypothetical protein
MQSPVPDVCLSSLDAPFSVERKRRARALDIMG